MSCRWCLRQFVSSNTQCFERDSRVEPIATVNADLTRGGPWHPQPAKRILEQLEGEARP